MGLVCEADGGVEMCDDRRREERLPARGKSGVGGWNKGLQMKERRDD